MPEARWCCHLDRACCSSVLGQHQHSAIPTEGEDRANFMLCKSAGECMSCSGTGWAYKSWGREARNATQIMMFSTETLSFTGEKQCLSPSSCFWRVCLEAPVQNRHKRLLWIMQYKTYKKLVFLCVISYTSKNIQRNVHEPAVWLFTISLFTPPWLSHIPPYPLRNEGTEWDTSAENETLSAQKS